MSGLSGSSKERQRACVDCFPSATLPSLVVLFLTTSPLLAPRLGQMECTPRGMCLGRRGARLVSRFTLTGGRMAVTRHQDHSSQEREERVGGGEGGGGGGGGGGG